MRGGRGSKRCCMRAEVRSAKTEGRRQRTEPAPGAPGPKLQSPNSKREAAFTLVELTIVVAIIAVLVGIMVPAVSRVHQRAKAMSSQSMLSAIETGLEMFKADGNVGGDYPPSCSDADSNIAGSLPDRAVANPYARTGGGGGGFGGPGVSFPIPEMSGAGLLVWALAGADQLGTPGFKAFRDTTNNQSQLWSFDTGSGPTGTDYTPNKCSAYKLREDDGRPVHPRYGPYIDLSKMIITSYDGMFFPIPAEAEAYPEVTPQRRYPVFLDTFGSPILYWKADPAGSLMVDFSRLDQDSSGAKRGIYHWEDNWSFFDPDCGAYDPLLLRPGQREEDVTTRLHWDEAWYADYRQNPMDADDPPVHSFPDLIMNRKVTARQTPFRPDSYLLISPGADGRYADGGDDITNFK